MRKSVGVAAVALLILAADVWVMLGAESAVTFHMWPLNGRIELPPAVTVLLGVLIGGSAVAGVWAFSPGTAVSTPASGTASDAGIILRARLAVTGGIALAVTTGILLIAAARMDKIEPVTAALVYLLGWLATLATLQAIRGLSTGDGVSFDSYWGGLGGAQGGWRLSPMTTSLILALVLVSGTVAVATGRGPALSSSATENKIADAPEENAADGASEEQGNTAADDAVSATEAGANAATSNAQ